MIILVSDTSILIDLDRGGLLEAAFSCGFTLIVPDLLYEKELEPENGAYLKSLGLGVVSLTSDEVAFAQVLRNTRKALSLADCFALSCAVRPDHVLLTGDKALRSEATSRQAQVYGLLWMLDQMSASGVVSHAVLIEGLTRISSHQRCRLPQAEVHKRLARWNAL